MIFVISYDANGCSIFNREHHSKEDYFSHTLGRYIFDLSPLHQGKEKKFFLRVMRKLGFPKERAKRAWSKVLHGLRTKEHVSFELAYPDGLSWEQIIFTK